MNEMGRALQLFGIAVVTFVLYWIISGKSLAEIIGQICG